MIRNVTLGDAEKISEIYNKYITETQITFEEETITVDEMRSRIQTITKKFPWIVYENDGEVIGYTYAAEWKNRTAYRHTVETAIYLDPEHLGKGADTQLKAAMIDELRGRDFHGVISGIALPNPASIALCKKFGFKKVAHFKEAGYKFGKWIDVVYWQLML